MVCFVHFHLEMCFAPQWRALFRHRNCQKWSDHGVFCTFSLGNVLRATTACTFSTSQLPKVVRTWCVLYILTWTCASRHNGVHFFIFHLASWLRTRRFSEPTFRASGAKNHWKDTVFRDFPTFSRICIFFLLTLLSSDLSLLSASSLLCFSSVHIVGSLTSKLPSIIWLVVSTPLKILVSRDDYFQYMENVPDHQPVIYCVTFPFTSMESKTLQGMRRQQWKSTEICGRRNGTEKCQWKQHDLSIEVKHCLEVDQVQRCVAEIGN